MREREVYWTSTYPSERLLKLHAGVIDRNRDERIKRDDFLFLQGIGQALAIEETRECDKKTNA